MTGVAAVLREIAAAPVEFVVGIGEGAIIALGASLPRVAEAALATRLVQDFEGPRIADGWHSVRALVISATCFYKVSDLPRLQAAVPELFATKLQGEESWLTFAIDQSVPHKGFVN